MKKELRTYDIIIGLTDFDEYSYCEKDQMWYEDAIEVLPQPEKESDVVPDFICEIKVNHWGCLCDNWEEVEEEKNGLEDFASYVLGAKNGSDCTWNATLFKTQKQQLITGFNDYGLWGLESFIKKLKEQSFATEYLEDGDARKFIAWTDENNQTRFVIHSYRQDYEYLKTIFDITIDRNILVSKLENILSIWRETIDNAIRNQINIIDENIEIRNEKCINHFFPNIQDYIEEKQNKRISVQESIRRSNDIEQERQNCLEEQKGHEKQEAEKKPKEYTAFGVTGGIGTIIGLFFAILLYKMGLLIPWIPDFIEHLKRFFGG